MTRYALKDKVLQEKLDALSDENKFSERLQVICEKEILDDFDYIIVCFGILSIGITKLSIRILKSEIEVIEDLKPYVWYPSQKFDENPNRYVLVERTEDEDEDDELYDISEDDFGITHLGVGTTHFMYIQRPDKSNEQLQL